MSSIKLSPKHGVNPCMSKCFFCGGDKGIVLLGKLKGDAEAPHEMVFDYEPCDACKEKFAKGVLLVGVSETCPDGRPPISKAEDGKELYPTGPYVVATEDFVTRMAGPEGGQKIIEAGKCVVPDTLVLEWQKQHEEACKGE